MLDPKSDRLDYGGQLAPPYGFELTHAIATSYSLDLDALLLIPIALFQGESLDHDPKSVREDMLQSIVDVAKRVTIYHQKGKIKVPDKYSALIAYWEKGLCAINPKQYNSSFHPKVWVLRYANEEGVIIYRVISTSRNLTLSRDWDLACSVEGQLGDSKKKTNESIIDFLKYLDGYKNVPKIFFEELPYVKFTAPAGFSEIAFHPIGIGNSSGKFPNPLSNDPYKKHRKIILSPFLDEKTLVSQVENCDSTMLFSSQIELSKISEEVLSRFDEVYMFSPVIEEAEHMEGLSESGHVPLSQNLHAKLFITEKGSQRNWFIGSANATQPAYTARNIEFLLELSGAKHPLRIEEVSKHLIPKEEDEQALFLKFEGSEHSEDTLHKTRHDTLRRIIYDISSIRFSADIIKNKLGRFDLVINLPKYDLSRPELMHGFEIKIKPLPEKHKASVAIDLGQEQEIKDFGDYDVTELSPYLIIELYFGEVVEKKFVLDMVIDLDQFKNRLNYIFSSIISNNSRFLSYLSYLLSDNAPAVIETTNAQLMTVSKGRENISVPHIEGTPIFEKLLLACSRYPDKIDEIERFMERLEGSDLSRDGALVLNEFKRMWSTFKGVKI